MKAIKWPVLMAVFLAPIVLRGQEEDLQKVPGYVDFAQVFDFDKDQATTEIEIKNPILSIVAAASEAEDPDLSKMLSFLKLIKVYTFETTPEQFGSIQERIERTDKKLINQNWERFVRVRKKNELTNIYMKLNGKKVAGLTILSVDEHETVFVNIVGTIDLSAVGKLGQKFNIPKLDSMQTKQ